MIFITRSTKYDFKNRVVLQRFIIIIILLSVIKISLAEKCFYFIFGFNVLIDEEACWNLYLFPVIIPENSIIRNNEIKCIKF